MNTKFIFFFFFAFQFFVVNAQESYFIRYDNGKLNSEVVQKIVKTSDDEIGLISTAETLENPYWGLTFRSIDTYNGEVRSRRDFTPSNFNTIDVRYSIFVGNQIYSTGLVHNTLNDIKNVFFYSFDIFGNNVLYSEYGTKDLIEFGNMIKRMYSTPEYIIVGSKRTGNDSFTLETLLLKVNNIGDSLWMRTIRSENIEMQGIGVETDLNDNIYALSDDQINLSLRRIAISKYTSTGDSLWTKYYPINGASFGKDIVRATNGNFVISGYSGFTENNYIAPFLMEIDTSGTVVWMEDYLDETGGAFANKIIRTNDGGYATCLDKNGVTLLVTDEKGRAIVIKNYDFGVDTPKDLLQLSDGSYMITGYISHPPNDDNYDTIWLIKTDPLGNVTTVSGVETETVPIVVYPNPTKDNIQIELPQSVGDYTIRLVNNLGTIVREVETRESNLLIDISFLSSGVYYLNVHKGKEFLGTKKIVKE